MYPPGSSFCCWRSTIKPKIDLFSSGALPHLFFVKKTDYNRLLLDCPVGNSTVMYNVDNMGKFEVPDIRKRNDDALWLQILKKEKYIYGMEDILME